MCVRQAVDWTRLLDHQVQACDVPAGVWHGPKPDFLVSAKSCAFTHMSSVPTAHPVPDQRNPLDQAHLVVGVTQSTASTLASGGCQPTHFNECYV